MKDHKNHHLLVKEYVECIQQVGRSNMYAIIFQGGAFGIIVLLTVGHVQNLTMFGTLLAAIPLMQRLRDFNFRRMLDLEMTRLTLQGIELEKQYSHLDRFFHEVLKKVGLFKALFQRGTLDVVCLWFFGEWLLRLILEKNPDFFSISPGWFCPVIAISCYFFANLYYKPIEALLIAKKRIFASA